MKPIIAVWLIGTMICAQLLNGYALCHTKLYTPAFTYWLIAVAALIGIVTVIVWCLLD